MLPKEDYVGKPQTYVKHYLLEYYLERVARNIYSFASTFVYVDGFSGPWRSSNEQYEDTSFGIALKKLEYVRNTQKQPRRLKCFFVEKELGPFLDLQKFLSRIKTQTVCVNGELENCVTEISDFVAKDFVFYFIDPTGFKGLSLRKLHPLFKTKSEVVINFMFNDVNRWTDHPDPKLQAVYDDFFGGPGWKEEINKKETFVEREEAILEVYCSRLKKVGKYSYVTSTKILFQDQNRTHFYLIYGTNHTKGLIEFRDAEHKAIQEQERVRLQEVRYRKSVKSGVMDLFESIGEPEQDNTRLFSSHKITNLARARDLIWTRTDIEAVRFKDLYDILQLPLVRISDLKDLIDSPSESNKRVILNPRKGQKRADSNSLIGKTEY